MSVERLWAPWRAEYVTSSVTVIPGGCVFCELAKPGEDRERLVLHRTERLIILMNRYPYNNGHLLVMPTAHVGHFSGLEQETFSELHRMLAQCASILEERMKAEGINIGLNLGVAAGAGIPDHMHYHLVPRWNGDTNFMPVVGETKVISQHILDTYDLLKPSF